MSHIKGGSEGVECCSTQMYVCCLDMSCTLQNISSTYYQGLCAYLSKDILSVTDLERQADFLRWFPNLGVVN